MPTPAKSTVLAVRLRRVDRKTLARAARLAGQTISAYVRDAALRDAYAQMVRVESPRVAA